MKKMILFITGIMLLTTTAYAKIITEAVEYKQGETVLEGFITYDSKKVSKNKKAPGVVVVHDWMGVGPYVKMRAEQLAEMGYVAFVADIYGKGQSPKDAKEAYAISSKYKSGDRKLLRDRAIAAYDTLKKSPLVIENKIAASGYCFGGTTVLEMARAGLPLTGVISFHGGLVAGTTNDAKNIKTKLLVLHGAIDPYVLPAEVSQFQKDLDVANVDYQLISYSGAVHSFTHKDAGTDLGKGAAYNEAADKRSFVAAKNFLTEINK